MEGSGSEAWQTSNIKQANKDVKIYVGRSTTLHNLLSYAHTLCMITQPKRSYWLMSESEVTTVVFSARSRLKKRTKTYNKEPFIFINRDATRSIAFHLSLRIREFVSHARKFKRQFVVYCKKNFKCVLSSRLHGSRDCNLEELK